MDMRHPAMRPRRLAVCGGGALEKENEEFCAVLGRLLAAQPGLVLVTGGLESRTLISDSKATDKPVAGAAEGPVAKAADGPVAKGKGLAADKKATDWAVAKAALDELNRLGLPVDEHIETMLPDKKREWEGAKRFEYGRIVILRNRSLQTRRFSVVNTTDATLTVSGGKGTKQIIDLALAIPKPVLPLPFTGGASREQWDINREEVMRWFGISEETAQRMESAQLPPKGSELTDIAKLVVDHLLPALRMKCFVAMPYADDFGPTYLEAVQPAIRACGFREVRADQLEVTGNALDILRQGILFCDVLIADISEGNPNVMYELGLAHAQNKPTILICRVNDHGELPKLPFDVSHERVIGYDADLIALRDKVSGVLRHMFPSFGSGA